MLLFAQLQIRESQRKKLEGNLAQPEFPPTQAKWAG